MPPILTQVQIHKGNTCGDMSACRFIRLKVFFVCHEFPNFSLSQTFRMKTVHCFSHEAPGHSVSPASHLTSWCWWTLTLLLQQPHILVLPPQVLYSRHSAWWVGCITSSALLLPQININSSDHMTFRRSKESSCYPANWSLFLWLASPTTGFLKATHLFSSVPVPFTLCAWKCSELHCCFSFTWFHQMLKRLTIIINQEFFTDNISSWKTTVSLFTSSF